MPEKSMQEKWFDRACVAALIFFVLVVLYMVYSFDIKLAIMLVFSVVIAPYVADRIP